MSKEVAIVIVNWNKKNDVLRLLQDLQQIPEKVDIFVVDNASTDGSAAAIEQTFPIVHVIRNPVNLGGTGGFNSGLRHVLDIDTYRCVWLLDNDAAIRSDTLTELLKAMDTDPSIGIVGSRIVDIDSRAVTVETGGKIRWDIMAVEPLNRNSTIACPEIIDADYVAVCSALVRTDALSRVGLMDSRLFVFWDDMDWGLYFQKHGYRVVCAAKSIVYHGSFTERDRGMQISYYGVRNSLLVYTKHTRFLQRPILFYRTLHYLLLMRAFLLINQKHAEAGLILQAVRDYIHNRWGKLSSNPPQAQPPATAPAHRQLIDNPRRAVKILVSVMNISREASSVLLKAAARIFPDASVTVLVHNDRETYYDGYSKISVDRKKTSRLIYFLEMFLQIKKKGFDYSLAIRPYPLFYAARNVICLNQDGDIESQTRAGWWYFPRLGAAVVSASIATFLLLPIVLIRSVTYGEESV